MSDRTPINRTPTETMTIAAGDRALEFDATTDTERRTLEYIAEHEYDVVAAFAEAIRPGDVVYDVGANVGVHACFAAAERSREVVAFEPYGPNVDALERNASLNGVEVTVVESPLNDGSGQVPFKRPDEAKPGYQIGAISPERNATTDLRYAVQGDALIERGEIPPPNVVKIDVEGAGLKVIEGLADALSRPVCHTVFCEVHLPSWVDRPAVQDFDADPDAIRAALVEQGFSVQRFQDVEKGYHLKADRPSAEAD